MRRFQADVLPMLLEHAASSEIAQERAQDAERIVLDAIEGLERLGVLRDGLILLFREAATRGLLPAELAAGATDEELEKAVERVHVMIASELCMRGRANDCANVFVPWDEADAEGEDVAQGQELLGAFVQRNVRFDGFTPRSAGEPSLLEDVAFLRGFEQMQGAEFLEGNLSWPALDELTFAEGPESAEIRGSFRERDRLIEEARESIWATYWSIYGDATGRQFVDALIRKHAESPEVDIRVIVDGQVALRPGHGEHLALLEDAGIPVVRWFRESPQDRALGTHRKMLIVDGYAVLAGGMNVGDWYSHRGPVDAPRWRDSDALVEGPSAAQAANLFARLWNEQYARIAQHREPTHGERIVYAAGTLEHRGLPDSDVDVRLAGCLERSGCVAVLDHQPESPTLGADGHLQPTRDPILFAMLRAFEGATRTIDIEHAYPVLTPPMIAALHDALDRGVRVRVLTNSEQSVDDPAFMGPPILGRMAELFDRPDGLARPEIWLRRGSTVHSKWLVVDGLYTQVGSYNLYGRSHRIDAEASLTFLDADFGRRMTVVFEHDLESADLAEPTRDRVPRSLLSLLTFRYFRNQI